MVRVGAELASARAIESRRSYSRMGSHRHAWWPARAKNCIHTVISHASATIAYQMWFCA